MRREGRIEGSGTGQGAEEQRNSRRPKAELGLEAVSPRLRLALRVRSAAESRRSEKRILVGCLLLMS